MKRGYGRVSTTTQNTKLQRDAMRVAGIDCADRNQYFEDKLSGAKEDRPEFLRCLAALEPGDELVVWTLDRAFRSFRYYVDVIEDLEARGVTFTCLTQPVLSTSGATGRLLSRIIAAVAAYEREITSQRVKAGMAATTKQLGQPTKVTPSKVILIKMMLANGIPRAEAARAAGIGRATMYRHWAELFEDAPPKKGKRGEHLRTPQGQPAAVESA